MNLIYVKWYSCKRGKLGVAVSHSKGNRLIVIGKTPGINNVYDEKILIESGTTISINDMEEIIFVAKEATHGKK